jgi:ferredoxin
LSRAWGVFSEVNTSLTGYERRMSDISEKFAENVPGKFYIAKVCIACSLCSEISPEHFAENLDEDLPVGNCYVCKQPENDDEESLCREAMENCPAGAIRDDGNE